MPSHLHTCFLFSIGLPGVMITVLVFLFCVPTTIWVLLRSFQRKWLTKKQLFLLQVQHDNDMLRARVETQEETFRHISAEVHDNIGQQLSLAHFHAERLEEQAAEPGQITSIIRRAIADLRDLSHSLSAEVISDEGLPAAIRKDISKLNRGGNLHAEFIMIAGDIHLPKDTAIILYRVFQEAIQNMLKHSKADKLKVFMNRENGELQLGIVDNGKGIPANTPDGNGFKNMKARLKLLGGNFSVETHEHGTSLMISTPYSHEKK